MSDNQENYFDRKCNHIMKESRVIRNTYFCNKCGVLEHEKIFSIKPNGFNYPCELDPFELIEKISLTANENYEMVNWENELISSYRKKREVNINFLKNITKRFSFRDSIFFQAINYMDHIILNNPNLNVNLVAFSCFILAAKFYGCDPKLPNLKEFNYQLYPDYSLTELKNYELMSLRLLNYNLDRSTCYDYLDLFLKNGIVFEGEISTKKLEKLYHYNLKILNNFIFDQRYFDFNPLQIACAIVRLSREVYKIEGWPEVYEKIYRIRSEDFMNCYFVIKTLYKNKSTNSRTKILNINLNSVAHCMKNKNTKNTKSFHSPIGSDSGLSRDLNFIQDKYNYRQNNTNLPHKEGKSEVKNYSKISEISCSLYPSVTSVSSIPTYTPSYFNLNTSQLTNNTNNNDYYVNINNISNCNKIYPKEQKIKKKISYNNSSDNNDLNSTFDEIVDNKNISTLPSQSSRMQRGNQLESIDSDLNINISPFNFDYYPSYNSNNYFNYPGNSSHVYPSFSMQNFPVKSNTSFIKTTCIQDNFFINTSYLDHERQMQPPTNFHLFN